MKPTIPNAFIDPDGKAPANPRASLTRMLSSMRSRLVKTAYGYELRLRPMRAIDALTVWPEICLSRHPRTLLTPAGRRPGIARRHQRAAERLGVDLEHEFELGHVTVDTEALRHLATFGDVVGSTAVCVEGPIEAADAAAITAATEAGGSPLEAEVRAVAALRFERVRTVVLHVRSKDQAIILIAESFRQYASALRPQAEARPSRPELGQVEQLLGDSGVLNIRPIETEVFSTAIDVGINTDDDQPTGPATRSIIFDVPSNTWHCS